MGMAFADGNIEFATTPDGAKLRIGHWPAPRDDGPGRVLLLQGRTEFLEKYIEVIDELGARGFEVWALDWRGQGLSDRLLENRHKGHIDRFETFLDDLHWFANAVVPLTGKRRTVVLAHSMGGHIAMRAMLEGRLRPERAVLSAPMFDLPVSGIKRMGARLLAATATGLGAGGVYVPGMGDYEAGERTFEGNPFTGDRTRFDRMRAAVAANTDLALGGATLGWSHAAFKSIDTLERLSQEAPDICPVLVCSGLSDRVVSVPAHRDMAARLEACTCLSFEGAQHEILIETDPLRQKFWEAFDEFVSAPEL
jgi:lysophospholipase